ncbi:peptidoglycan-binding domain-containing protein [Actinomycetes bacterium KLBMP 9797]
MSRRRTRVVVAGGLAVAAAAGGTAAALGLGGSSGGAAGGDLPPPTTAQVARSTLVDEETVDGTLDYGTPVTVSSKPGGTVTWLPAEEAVVRRGGTLYKVDDEPVVLLRGALPMYRRLATGTEGADVKLLEQNLAALGYDGFTVDEEYTSSTAAAVEEWQEALGVDETGVVEPGQVVYAAGDLRVSELKSQVGDSAGRPVLTYTGTTRVVTVDLEVEQQRLAAVGAAVTVELPDGKEVAGKVTATEAVVDVPAQGQDAETKLEVTVALADQKALGALDVATVDVTFVAARRENVLSVPVNALLALVEGGYGVEVVDGTGTRIVPVELGLFSGGRVEVTGAGLTEGTTVGVAS